VRLLADECFDGSVVQGLRRLGHDVAYIAEHASGLTDPEVLGLAVAEGRLLITEDKDFGEIVIRLRRPAIGVVLLRMDRSRPAEKLARLISALHLAPDRLHGNLIVVSRERVRFHPLRGRAVAP
jgi:predicted nuclease of predicted toxin-antitoxin system